MSAAVDSERQWEMVGLGGARWVVTFRTPAARLGRRRS